MASLIHKMNIYSAVDNNGDLVCLTTDKQFASKMSDSHFKDAYPIDILEDFPLDTPVCNGKGRDIGTLRDFVDKDAAQAAGVAFRGAEEL